MVTPHDLAEELLWWKRRRREVVERLTRYTVVAADHKSLWPDRFGAWLAKPFARARVRQCDRAIRMLSNALQPNSPPDPRTEQD